MYKPAHDIREIDQQNLARHLGAHMPMATCATEPPAHATDSCRRTAQEGTTNASDAHVGLKVAADLQCRAELPLPQ